MSELDKTRRGRKKSSNGRTSELRAAQRFEGRVHSGSGAHHPGGGGGSANDFSTDLVSVEWKYTDAASYSLKDIECNHAWSVAVGAGKVGIFGIEFSSGNKWVVLKEEDYLDLLHDVEGMAALLASMGPEKRCGS